MDRAKVQLTDIVIASVVTISAYAVAPIMYTLIGKIIPTADPLSELMLQLVIPFLFIGIIISVGVSARRRD